MEMTKSEIRRMYSQSKNKWTELSIIAELNGCSIEQIAEIVADIPIDDEISQKRVEGVVNGQGFIYHRDVADYRDMVKENFAINLKRIMDKKGLSSYKLAMLSNTSKTSMNEYINKIKLPDMITLVKIARTLDVSTDELIGIEELKNVKRV